MFAFTKATFERKLVPCWLVHYNIAQYTASTYQANPGSREADYRHWYIIELFVESEVREKNTLFSFHSPTLSMLW